MASQPRLQVRARSCPAEAGIRVAARSAVGAPAGRVRKTVLLQAWTEDVAVVGGQGFTCVEIELWFRDGAARRAAVQADIERLITTARGTVISSAVVPSIDYHAVLADLPYDQVQAVLKRGPESSRPQHRD